MDMTLTFFPIYFMLIVLKQLVTENSDPGKHIQTREYYCRGWERGPGTGISGLLSSRLPGEGREPSRDGRFLFSPGTPFLLEDFWGRCLKRGNRVEGTELPKHRVLKF